MKTLEIVSTAGINVNVADYDGRTALHLAVSNGRMDATQRLLDMADIQVLCLATNSVFKRLCTLPVHTPHALTVLLHAVLLPHVGRKYRQSQGTHTCSMLQ